MSVDQQYNMKEEQQQIHEDIKKETKKLNWHKTLYDYRVSIFAEAYQNWDKNLQMDGRSILEKDLPRTRGSDSRIQRQSVQTVLRRIATFYCKDNNFHYQQGLLEVILPFALLHNKHCKTSKCYAYFNLFMKKHVPKVCSHKMEVLMQRVINNKKQLPHTVLALNCISCLLNFHYPSIYDLFKQEDVQMSMIATQQLMTIFAKSLELKLVYMLFDKLINKNDANFIFFLCVTLIGRREREIVEASQAGKLEKYIQNLKEIKTQEDLNKWFDEAEQVQKQTPDSFSEMVDNLGFNHKSILSIEDSENMLNSSKIFFEDLLPIYLSEVKKSSDKFVIVLLQGSCRGFSFLSLKKAKQYNRRSYQGKILVLAINEQQEQQIGKLASFAGEFEGAKIGLLRERAEAITEKQLCCIF